MTVDQLLTVANHIKTKPEYIAALQYHFIGGLKVHQAEKKAGLPDKSLRKKVERVKKELEYIERYQKAGLVNEEQLALGM